MFQNLQYSNNPHAHKGTCPIKTKGNCREARVTVALSLDNQPPYLGLKYKKTANRTRKEMKNNNIYKKDYNYF